MTRPLPLGRSGLRSMLFRSRKSSSRASAGSSTSITGSIPSPWTTAGAQLPSSTIRRPSDRRPPTASCAAPGLKFGEALLQPLLAGASLDLDQLPPRGATPTPTPDDRRRGGRPLSTNPSSASDAMTRVIDGGRTRSRTASAPGVIGPSLASVASADSCDSDTGESGRRKRNWRAKRTTASDKSLASRASASVTSQTVPTPLPDPVQATVLTGTRRARSARFVRDGRDDTRARRRFPRHFAPPHCRTGAAPAARCGLLQPWPVIVAMPWSG